MLKLDQLSQSWHLIGHRVSMTWRILTTLFLFGLLVNLSMQACGDYFSASEWVNYLKENVTLAKAKQPKDFLNCTVLYESKKSNYFYNILDLCLQNNITEEMCDGETSQKLSFFNFMCILARSLDFADVDLKETGCQYSEYTENGENKSICQMHSDLLPFAKLSTTAATATLRETTKIPTTTLQETTKMPTTLQETTNISTTTLQETTNIAATTPQETTNIAATTPQETTNIAATTPQETTNISTTTPQETTNIAATTPQETTNISTTTPQETTKMPTTLQETTNISTTTPQETTNIAATTPQETTNIAATTPQETTNISTTTPQETTKMPTTLQETTNISTTTPQETTNIAATTPQETTNIAATTPQETTNIAATTPQETTNISTTTPQETTKMPTTLQETTNISTTTPQETTNIAATTPQETTFSSTLSRNMTLVPTTTTTTTTRARTLQSELTATLTTTQSTGTGNNAVSNRPEKIQEQKDDLKTKTMQYCLMVSLALNVILPLAVYLRMRKMPPDRSQRENNGSSQGSQQIIVLQPVTHLEFENRDQVENIQLLEGSSQWIILFCLTLSSVSSCVPPTPLMLCFTASMNHLLGLCLLLLSGNFILNIRLPMCSASILCTCPNLLQTVLILFFFPFSPPELSLCTAKEKERNFRRHCTQISSTQGSCSIRPKNRIQSALALVT
ncbi:uncharacterized protein DDB_G0290587-like isoform X2 [Channa argus]|uniref:uncharacterized protein DDB_G0290587-like isoform X2 n=2 Tax=Channa argus TaxID=215402 RepID=UPI0035203AC6